MEKIKVLEGTAMYTGGGIYMVLGKLSDGNYFIADNWDVCVYDSDVREEDLDYDFVGVSPNWCEKHFIEDFPRNEVRAALLDFCHQLDEGKANEDGWRDFSNYARGEVFDYLCDVE